MNIPNLFQLTVSLTDFKKQISEIINRNETKIIIRNNEPVSIFMPYATYLAGNEKVQLPGEDIQLANGTQIKVIVEPEDEQVAIKTYLKMKNSDKYKLYFTQYVSNPSMEQTLTEEELRDHYLNQNS